MEMNHLLISTLISSFPSLSLLSQRSDRIDPARAPRGKVRGEKPRGGGDDDHRGEGQRVELLDTEEEALERPGERDREPDSDRDPERREPRPVPQYEREDVFRRALPRTDQEKELGKGRLRERGVDRGRDLFRETLELLVRHHSDDLAGQVPLRHPRAERLLVLEVALHEGLVHQDDRGSIRPLVVVRELPAAQYRKTHGPEVPRAHGADTDLGLLTGSDLGAALDGEGARPSGIERRIYGDGGGIDSRGPPEPPP